MRVFIYTNSRATSIYVLLISRLVSEKTKEEKGTKKLESLIFCELENEEGLGKIFKA